MLPLLEHDLCRYYKDQLILESDHAEMALNKDDERVLAFYDANIEEVVDSMRQKRLQLPLS